MYEKNIKEYFELLQFYKNPNIIKVFHNANFDKSIIQRTGIPINGKTIDTMILSFVDNCSNPIALKPLCKKLFNIDNGDQEDLIKSVNKARRIAKKHGWKIAIDETGFDKESNKADYWLGDPDLCEKYAVLDSDRTMGLFWSFEDKYNSDKSYRTIVEMEHEVARIIMEMQDIGIKIDLEKIKELIKYYKNISAIQNKIKNDLGYASLNPYSSKQMKEVFYDKLKCEPIYKRRKGKDGESSYSLTTDSDTLNKWAKTIPLAKALVEISASEHELNTFIIPFRETSVQIGSDKILRPSYNSVGVITGRISCSKPNLMNISSDDSVKKVSDTSYRSRECFIPRDGCKLCFFDYKQIEVWIAAFLSRDETMMKYLLEGGDLHSYTSYAVYGSRPDYNENLKAYRKKGKTLNFGSIYGMGAKGFMLQVGCSYNEALEAHAMFWDTYKGLSNYSTFLSDEVSNLGYIINPFERKYYMESKIAYRALNFMIQGSAAEIMKRAMINVSKFISGTKAKFLLTIHDEICIEIPTGMINRNFIGKIISEMKSNFHERIGIPIHFGVEVAITSTNWADKKELKL
jgi:DNA polymerase-1